VRPDQAASFLAFDGQDLPESLTAALDRRPPATDPSAATPAPKLTGEAEAASDRPKDSGDERGADQPALTPYYSLNGTIEWFLPGGFPKRVRPRWPQPVLSNRVVTTAV
jgi:hypothetical protein